MKSRAVLLAITFLFASSAFGRDVTFPELRLMARNAIRNRSVTFAEPMFEIRRSERTIFYFLGSISLEPDDIKQDRDQVALFSLMHIELIRSRYGKGFNSCFWEWSARSAERLVECRWRELRGRRVDQKQLEKIWQDLQVAVGEIFHRSVKNYARQIGYRALSEAAYVVYHFTFVTEPPGGQVFIMHLLDWVLKQKRGVNPQTFMDQVATEGTNTGGGQYIVMVKRKGKVTVTPRTLRVSDHGTFVCHDSGSIEFRKNASRFESAPPAPPE